MASCLPQHSGSHHHQFIQILVPQLTDTANTTGSEHGMCTAHSLCIQPSLAHRIDPSEVHHTRWEKLSW